MGPKKEAKLSKTGPRVQTDETRKNYQEGYDRIDWTKK